MTIQTLGMPYGIPQEPLYDPGMARTELMGVENTRKVLGDRIKKAREDELHTVMTRHGQPWAVLVNVAWYQAAREALGDPSDLYVPPAPENADT